MREGGREREREREREKRTANTPYLLLTVFAYSYRISFKHIKATKIGQEIPQDDDEPIIPASSNTV